MSDPVVIAALVGTVGSTIISILTIILGITPQSLFFSLWGATVGLTFAPKAPLGRTIALFCAVIMGGASLAHWIVSYGPLPVNAVAFVLSALFHPILNSVVNVIEPTIKNIFGMIPAIIKTALKKIGIDLHD